MIVRPIRHEDADGLARAYTQLSEQSRWRRFLSVAEQIPPGLLRYLTSVNHHSHVAVVAIDPDTGEIRGSARYIRIPGRRPATAELAVEVIARWQRRLGRGLVQALGTLTQANGVQQLLAIVSNDNVPMQLLPMRWSPGPDERLSCTCHGPTPRSKESDARTGRGSHMRQRLTVTRSRGFGPLAMTNPPRAGEHGR